MTFCTWFLGSDFWLDFFVINFMTSHIVVQEVFTWSYC